MRVRAEAEFKHRIVLRRVSIGTQHSRSRSDGEDLKMISRCVSGKMAVTRRAMRTSGGSIEVEVRK
jgi:hypothetical protein